MISMNASMRAHPPTCSVKAIDMQTFHLVNRLGSNIPVAIVVKNAANGNLAAQRLEERKKIELAGNPYAAMRIRSGNRMGEGFLLRTTLGNMEKDEGQLYRRLKGRCPYGYASRAGIFLIAFSGQIKIMSSETNEVLNVIEKPEFRHLHSLQFSPSNPNVVLISDTGTNRIFEFNLDEGRTVWEWDPYVNGYSRNKLGLDIYKTGTQIAESDEVKFLSYEEAHRMMQIGTRISDGKQVISFVDLDKYHPTKCIRPWQNTAGPNWSGYNPFDPNKIFSTLFSVNQAIEIDKRTGAARVVFGDLDKPHGSILPTGGIVISDSCNGRVLIFDTNHELQAIYNFTEMPIREECATRKHEWIQNTHPINSSLLATVDSRRSQFYVWDREESTCSIYPFNSEWNVQAIMPQINS